MNILDYIPYLNKKIWGKAIITEDENSCWEWIKEKDRNGYGVLCIYEGRKKIRRISASRASWIITNNKDVPDGMVICHKCDNPSCIRPSHLFLGSYKDNMQDCKAKGRTQKGRKGNRRKTRNIRYTNVKDRFTSKFVVNDNGCWIWNSSLDKNGYGVFLYKKKVKPAHRISWTIFVGEIPEGCLVCHKCDNRHLFTGTAKDNAVDCARKGRNTSQINPHKIPRGEKHGNSKLTAEQVLNIIKEHNMGGISQAKLAKKYNISQMVICRILDGSIWKSVTASAKDVKHDR